MFSAERISIGVSLEILPIAKRRTSVRRQLRKAMALNPYGGTAAAQARATDAPRAGASVAGEPSPSEN
ncbi:MAG: hypothetical protein MR874_05810 [Coriobacteriaceae bacterium]|nr:hypothetical protein [Coriobacteriaceae bacterium]MCI6844256.1 hypothetical protein [Coriobacteriaceae bacterium]MCI7437761.1 hypothetical protein [Coriobacteriaceae bacterium]